MITASLIVWWIFCFAVSLIIMIVSATKEFDLTIADLIFFSLMSLMGPVSLLAAIVFFLISGGTGSFEKVVIKGRRHD